MSTDNYPMLKLEDASNTLWVMPDDRATASVLVKTKFTGRKNNFLINDAVVDTAEIWEAAVDCMVTESTEKSTEEAQKWVGKVLSVGGREYGPFTEVEWTRAHGIRVKDFAPNSKLVRNLRFA